MADTLRPTTYFLEDAAALARGSILARLDPRLAYQPFFRLDLGGEVPEARHASWDYCDMAGRFVDALIQTVPMVGAEVSEAEEGLRAFLLDRANPRDGLFYDAEAPWSTYAADMFCQGRALIGLVSWFLLTGDAAVEAKIEGQIAGLSRIAVWDGDACFYPKDIWIEDHFQDGGLWNGGHPGYAAQQVVGLARYARATGSPSALRLAGGLSRHFAATGPVRPDGTFTGHTHSQGILPTLLGILQYALVAGDADLAAWCQRAYEHARRHTSSFGWIPDGLGFTVAENRFAGTCETCALADLIELAISLTDAGLGGYWDDVELFARNQLLEQQLRDVSRVASDEALSASSTPVAGIIRGAFDSAAHPNTLIGDLHGVVEGCCTPAGARACFAVWDRVITQQPDGIHVNLAFSRDSPWASLISSEPYKGELRLEVRQAAPFFLRLPKWADATQVRLTVDGAERPVELRGRELVLGDAHAGQTFVVIYPTAEREQIEMVAEQDYAVRWKGGTVTEITPSGGRYPIYQRAAYNAAEPPLAEREAVVRPVVVRW